VLHAALQRGVDPGALAPMAERTRERVSMVDRFVQAYRRYCWPVGSLDDVRLAPFQVLAGEGKVHALEDHAWHLETLDALCAAGDGVLQATRHLAVDVTDPASQEAAERWWSDMTDAGGEGMVVKPASPVAKARRGIPQPGIKVRGREYLRIVYGPEYTAPANISRLRERALGHKRSLALREFALGIESLERFVQSEPLYRVHECVFGVLALESEPVDPAL
jgi:protein phosphatase